MLLSHLGLLAQLADTPQVRKKMHPSATKLKCYQQHKGMVQTGMGSVRDGLLGDTREAWTSSMNTFLINKFP